MTGEFTHHGKTYQFTELDSLSAPAPPKTLMVPFRPCVLKPPFFLELAWLATDEIRGIELYRPVREIR